MIRAGVTFLALIWILFSAGGNPAVGHLATNGVVTLCHAITTDLTNSPSLVP